MQTSTNPRSTPAAQRPAISGTYRAEHCDTGLSIRLHCPLQQIGEPLRIEPQLTRAERATPFVSREAAELIAARFFPHIPVEIVRVDA